MVGPTVMRVPDECDALEELLGCLGGGGTAFDEGEAEFILDPISHVRCKHRSFYSQSYPSTPRRPRSTTSPSRTRQPGTWTGRTRIQGRGCNVRIRNDIYSQHKQSGTNLAKSRFCTFPTGCNDVLPKAWFFNHSYGYTLLWLSFAPGSP